MLELMQAHSGGRDVHASAAASMPRAPAFPGVSAVTAAPVASVAAAAQQTNTSYAPATAAAHTSAAGGPATKGVAPKGGAAALKQQELARLQALHAGYLTDPSTDGSDTEARTGQGKHSRLATGPSAAAAAASNQTVETQPSSPSTTSVLTSPLSIASPATSNVLLGSPLLQPGTAAAVNNVTAGAPASAATGTSSPISTVGRMATHEQLAVCCGGSSTHQLSAASQQQQAPQTRPEQSSSAGRGKADSGVQHRPHAGAGCGPMDEDAAALKIQAVYRGHRARRDARVQRKAAVAATARNAAAAVAGPAGVGGGQPQGFRGQTGAGAWEASLSFAGKFNQGDDESDEDGVMALHSRFVAHALPQGRSHTGSAAIPAPRDEAAATAAPSFSTPSPQPQSVPRPILTTSPESLPATPSPSGGPPVMLLQQAGLSPGGAPMQAFVPASFQLPSPASLPSSLAPPATRHHAQGHGYDDDDGDDGTDVEGAPSVLDVSVGGVSGVSMGQLQRVATARTGGLSRTDSGDSWGQSTLASGTDHLPGGSSAAATLPRARRSNDSGSVF